LGNDSTARATCGTLDLGYRSRHTQRHLARTVNPIQDCAIVADTYDVIVVGLGAMGSATSYHLARRGLRVLGIDRHAPPHDMGSSHGLTRIIREAYYEHPLYVPLVRRAFELWTELEPEATNERTPDTAPSGLSPVSLPASSFPPTPPLLVRNGGLTIGRPDSSLVRGALLSAREHAVPHEVLTRDEMHERFPLFELVDDWIAVFEPGAGFVRPEACIAKHLERARECGAVLQLETAVTGWQGAGPGLRVQTTQGSFDAPQVVVCAGAWTKPLLGGTDLPLEVERQVSHWFAPIGNTSFGPSEMPVAMWELDRGQILYTTPDVGRGVKAGFHHGGEVTTGESVRRAVAPSEVEEMRHAFGRLVPLAAGESRGSAVCLYTNTPDAHFVIDWHPADPRVLIVTACSGHGFKFSAAIGEVAADLVEGKPPSIDLSPFRLARFA
jgi:sarcosine oxidase